MPSHTDNSGQSSHVVNPEQSAVLTKFLVSVSEEDKNKFLRTLDEEERMQFSSSLEEFRQVFGRDPEQKFPKEKPDFERDVKFSGVKIERIRERFEEVMKMFPEQLTPEALRARIAHEDTPKSNSLFRSTDELREVGDAPKIAIKLVIS